MKKVLHISHFLAAVLVTAALGYSSAADAQVFSESSAKWRTETDRAKGLDSIKVERHSFLSVPKLSDTSVLTYHEPLPDNLMPKSAIDLGTITIQAESSDEVIEILEAKARELGADWIISFNEPRIKRLPGGDYFYRSQARLYKVINAELVPESEIMAVDLGEQHIGDYASVLTWVSNYVTHDEQ